MIGVGRRCGIIRALVLTVGVAAPAAAQEGGFIPDLDLDDNGGFVAGTGVTPEGDVVQREVEPVSRGRAAVLRGLDKTSGTVRDVTLEVGESQRMGRLEIRLAECRYPVDNPSGNAYAYLTIREAGEALPAFDGWMVAASPALNPLDHPRYDVWVMRCTIS